MNQSIEQIFVNFDKSKVLGLADAKFAPSASLDLPKPLSSGKVRASESAKLFDARGKVTPETLAKDLARRLIGLSDNDSYGDSISHGIRSEPKALKHATELMRWDSLERTGENQLKLDFPFWSGYPDGIVDGLYPVDAKSPTSNNTWAKLMLCKDLNDFRKEFRSEYCQLQCYIMGCEAKFEQPVNYGFFAYYFEKNENNAYYFRNNNIENDYAIFVIRIPADRELWKLVETAAQNACELRDEKYETMMCNTGLNYVEWDFADC